MSRVVNNDENVIFSGTNLLGGSTEPITTCLWVKVPAASGATCWPMFLIKDGTSDQGYRYELDASNNSIGAKVANSGPFSAASLPGGSFLDDTWIVIIGRYLSTTQRWIEIASVGAARTVSIVDGGSVPTAGMQIQHFLLGNWWPGSIIGLKIGEFAVWNRDLTTAERDDLTSKKPNAAAASGLLCYLSMETSSLTDSIGGKVFAGGTFDSDHPALTGGAVTPPLDGGGLLLLGVG